ncbi:MAG: ATP-binding cassette domain-containing protein [Bacillota bacterium]|nr:ATP-binding cassette domain-containing protein [Bacillota bacterium]
MENTKEAVIEIKNLTKKYGKNVAVDSINFTVNRGEIVGFLGPNGAGKSTTMNMLTGYLSATSGSARIDGYNILSNPKEVKQMVGYLPEMPPLYMDMTVLEYLNFVYELKKVELSRNEHISEIIEMTRLGKVQGKLINNLSKGYKQRVGLAQALIGNPEVLILDEPTIGLDPMQIIEVREMIKKFGENRTVIISTHILQEVNAICDRVIIINKGKIVAEDTIEHITKKNGEESAFQLRVKSDEKVASSVLSRAHNLIEEFKAMSKHEQGMTDFIVYTKDGVDTRGEIIKFLVENNLEIVMMKPVEMTLEEVFIKVVNGSDKKLESGVKA